MRLHFQMIMEENKHVIQGRKHGAANKQHLFLASSSSLKKDFFLSPEKSCLPAPDILQQTSRDFFLLSWSLICSLWIKGYWLAMMGGIFRWSGNDMKVWQWYGDQVTLVIAQEDNGSKSDQNSTRWKYQSAKSHWVSKARPRLECLTVDDWWSIHKGSGLKMFRNIWMPPPLPLPSPWPAIRSLIDIRFFCCNWV